MPKFRKKPVVVEAVQVWANNETWPATVRYDENQGGFAVFDNLHDTWVHFESGDWIITGVQGETYPCKPDIFAATYEPARPRPCRTARDEIAMFTKGMRVEAKDVSRSGDIEYYDVSGLGTVIEFPVRYDLEGYPEQKEWVHVRFDNPGFDGRHEWLMSPEELIPLDNQP